MKNWEKIPLADLEKIYDFKMVKGVWNIERAYDIHRQTNCTRII